MRRRGGCSMERQNDAVSSFGQVESWAGCELAWRNVQYKQYCFSRMDQNREWGQEEVEFQINEIVWAKITGFPWWPAKITNKAHPPQHLYRVDFFRDNTHAFLNCSKIAKYDTLRDTLDLGKQTSKNLKKAIAEADKALEQQKLKANAAESCTVPVEVINLNQKQLLQQSSPPSQHLQEIIPPSHISDSHCSHEEDDGEQQQDNSAQQKPQSQTIAFSKQQRLRFVKNLLKKYRLISLPKCDDSPAQKTSNKTAPYPLRKRHIYSRKSNEIKIKRSTKLPYPKQTLSFFLSRKIHHLLKQKQDLKGRNSKEISLSLSRQLLCGGGGAQEVNRLFRWLGISSAQTIMSFYQNWSSIQTDKEKASNMTTEE